MLGLLDKGGMQSIQEFDERFRRDRNRCSIGFRIWKTSYGMRGWRTGSSSPPGSRVCEEGLRRFPAEDDLMTENRRRALAESYFELGETAKRRPSIAVGCMLDPRWGWGWIGWSDCYRFTRTERRDWSRANRSCGKGLPSRRSGIARTCSTGSPMRARSRDGRGGGGVSAAGETKRRNCRGLAERQLGR